MRRDSLFLILIALVVGLGIISAGRDHPAAGNSPDNHPDFAGHWELNLAQSRFGKMVVPSRMTLEATRRGEVLHALQTTYDPTGGPSTVEGDWFLDGKEHPLGADGKLVSMSEWDHNTLLSERKSKDGAYDETIRMTLSSDGKTATEEIKVKDPNGSDMRKLRWNRK